MSTYRNQRLKTNSKKAHKIPQDRKNMAAPYKPMGTVAP